MSQDNMPALPGHSFTFMMHDGKKRRVCTEDELHAYARQYAAQMVAQEREACAALCETYMGVQLADGTFDQYEPSPSDYRAAGAMRCSQAIRARSEGSAT